jgi:hypothetical protein
MDPLFTLEVSNIPQGVCARLLTSSSGSEGFAWGFGYAGFTTPFSSGTVLIAARASSTTSGLISFRNYAMNPTQAGWMCRYGSSSYPDKANEPTGATPLSGNVTVTLWILLNV